jgi:tetratricopeptide (TPR) repeat protein
MENAFWSAFAWRRIDKERMMETSETGKKKTAFAAGLTLFLILFFAHHHASAIHESSMTPEKIRWYRLMREGDDLISKGNIVAVSVAEENYKEALKLAEKVFGFKSEQTAESLRALALLLYKEGAYQKGYAYYDRYVELGSYNIGSNGGRDLFYAIVGVGSRLKGDKIFSEAEVIFDHSLEVAERHFARQVFGPTFSGKEKRRLIGELIEAVRELSKSMKDLFIAMGLREKARESDLRIRDLMTRIGRERNRY